MHVGVSRLFATDVLAGRRLDGLGAAPPFCSIACVLTTRRPEPSKASLTRRETLLQQHDKKLDDSVADRVVAGSELSDARLYCTAVCVHRK
jgi:hypothetical protein